MTAGRRALVTGCAGFIGSHLSEALLDAGWQVLGVDCFTPFYERERKQSNLTRLRDEPAFELQELDLAGGDLAGLGDGIDTAFHLGGEPGARQSFDGPDPYRRNNVLATKRMLAELQKQPPRCLVYASSSTTYGNARTLPTPESAALNPISPYGRTKVEGERLVLDAAGEGLHTVILRYFSGYGTRQRPDMALSRFIARMERGRPVPVFGDGSQLRDFTAVADLVRATLLASEHGAAGSIYNVGGGSSVSLRGVIELLGEVMQLEPRLELLPEAPGDVHETRADASLAARELGFTPEVELREGIAAQVEWALGAAEGAGRPA